MPEKIDISSEFEQIRDVLERMDARLTAIEQSGEEQHFSSQQIVPILQGTRADIVAMRLTLIRLANELDLPHEVRQLGDADRRKADRRKAG